MVSEVIKTAALRSDEPIREPAQDRLGRERLVSVLGEHILATSDRDPVVIALNARWGAGKSSFLNLLQGYLATEPASNAGGSPIVVRFNPWHYTTIDQLVRMFFDTLASAIGTAKKGELAKKVAKLLRTAGSLTAVFSSGAGTVLKDAAGAVDKEKTLPELKAQLDDLLLELEQRVVVFIDDIDRLEKDALRLLFRLVRLNADFANTTYVLAFDRLVVERNLDEDNGIRGRDYLEKIIQVSFDIPSPEPETLFRLLFQELDVVLGSVDIDTFDQHRWANLFHSGFKEHFRTIRHIKRYVNGLRLTLAPVVAEVDVLDFLVVELLRVFHPEVYSCVARMRDILAPGPTQSALGGQVKPEQLRCEVEDLCGKASDGFTDAVRALLKELFPELARAYRNTTYSHGFYAGWRRDRRVCAHEVFEKYFLLAVPGGEISEVALRSFIADLPDHDAAMQTMLAFRDSGRDRRLLERLEDYTETLSDEQRRGLLDVLFDVGDEMRFERRGFFDIGGDLQVARLVYQCLSAIDAEDDRADLLMELVARGRGLFTVVQEVSLSEPKPDGDHAGGRPLFSDRSRWEQARDLVVERIGSAARDGSLWTNAKLTYILFRWRDWIGEETTREAVSAHIGADDKIFVSFLRAFENVSHSHSMGDKVSRAHHAIRREELEHFLDAAAAEERLRRIASDETQPDLAAEARAVVALLSAGDERARW